MTPQQQHDSNLTLNEIRDLADKNSLLKGNGRIDGTKFANFLDKHDLTAYGFSQKSRKVSTKLGKPAIYPNTVETIIEETGGHKRTDEVLLTMHYIEPFKFKGHHYLSAPKRIRGRWKTAHITCDKYKKTKLVRSTLIIEDDGTCIIDHGIENQIYKGGITQIYHDIATIEFNLEDDDPPEKVIWKIKYNSKASLDELEGGWLGEDCDHAIKASAVLVAKKCPGTDNEIFKKIGHEPKIIAPPPNSNKVHDSISFRKIWKHVKSSRSGTAEKQNKEIRILTTYWDFTKQLKRLEHLDHIKWRIIFMDSCLNQLVQARFKLRPSTIDGVSAEAKIIGASNELLKLKKDLGADIELKFSSVWPVGMGVQVDQKVLFLRLMYATQSAVDSPVLEVRDKDSEAWKLFQQDFKAIWNSSDDDCSRPAWPEENYTSIE